MASDNISDTLQDSAEHFNKERQKFLIKISNKLLRKVKLKTPVGEYDNGKVGGTLRNNWHSKKVGEDTREVYNNTEYALHVEYGHRTRQGKGSSNPPKYKYRPKEGGITRVKGRYMLTKSVAEIENELEADLQKFMDNLWK